MCALGTKGEPGKGVSTPGPQGVPGPRGETGVPGLQGKQQHSHHLFVKGSTAEQII